jgi:DNA-binding NtrC family response regulator
MQVERKILVVDDDSYVCELLTDYFGRFEVSVESAITLEQAEAKLRNAGMRVALIDLKMKDTDGFKVMDRLQKVQPDLTVVIMTGFPTIESTLTALRRQVFDFVIKPFRLSELNHIVDRALRRAYNGGSASVPNGQTATADVTRNEAKPGSGNRDKAKTSRKVSSAEQTNGRRIEQQLERLRERRHSGELSENEYEAQRLQLLERL